MRELVIQFRGDDWDDEAEAEQVENLVEEALNTAGIEYLDLRVR